MRLFITFAFSFCGFSERRVSLSGFSLNSFMQMQDFVHLHVHTQYSILDGQASIPRLVDKAIADGMKGIAVTDHGDMFGIKEFFNYVNKKNGKTKHITVIGYSNPFHPIGNRLIH